MAESTATGGLRSMAATRLDETLINSSIGRASQLDNFSEGRRYVTRTRVGRGALVLLGLVSVGAVAGRGAVAAVVTRGAERAGRVGVTVGWRAVEVIALDTRAWRGAYERIPPFRRLYGVRLDREALNVGTASIGGEV